MPLKTIRQDITQMQVDAIVNTTNRGMIGYSGVDLAIHSTAGKELDEECKKLTPLESGQAKISFMQPILMQWKQLSGLESVESMLPTIAKPLKA